MEDQPATNELLENSLVDLDETYKEYKAVYTNRATHEFLWDSYEYLDAIYKDIVIPLSPAYLSGSDWYTGDDLPLALFELILMIGLIQNACFLAIQRGCNNPQLKKHIAASFEIIVDPVD